MIKMNEDKAHHAILHLSFEGQVKQDKNYLYLKVDDGFIHLSYPFIKTLQILKPDYFSDRKKQMGAHISIIYPEEKAYIQKKFIDSVHCFTLGAIKSLKLGKKIFHAFQVQSESLSEIRRQHQLPNQLKFRGQYVPFHLTIGIENS